MGWDKKGELTFLFALQGQELRPGVVEYITPDPLAGDYNGDGSVDLADYPVWRNALGTSLAAADGDGDGEVDGDDYTIWKWSFGNSAGAGGAAGSIVPEPSAIALLSLSVYDVGQAPHSSTELSDVTMTRTIAVLRSWRICLEFRHRDQKPSSIRIHFKKRWNDACERCLYRSCWKSRRWSWPA